MSLYNEYRPKTLDEIVGNETVIKGVRAHFAQEPKRVSHCHFLHGPSGCGKTTLARIIATELLGASPEFGIHEINTADNRGIDTAREVIEKMKSLPLMGDAVAFVVDEAHGLTTEAKRAFLKPTEDMPSYVYFFFCTTDLPQLLKGDEGKALGNRATMWKLEPLNARQLGRLVLRTADAENFDVADEVLSAIIEAAEGSPRLALKALEQVMACPGDIQGQLKLLETGVVENPDTLDLCRAVTAVKPSWSAIRDCLAKMKGKVDAETARRSILGYCSAIMLKSGGSDRICRVMEEFAVNTYDTGFPGLVLSAYRSLK